MKIVFKNTTDYPVFEWAAAVMWTDTGGASHRVVVNQLTWGLLAPGRTELEWMPKVPPRREADIRVELTFVDANGHQWVRTSTGGKRHAGRKDRVLLTAEGSMPKEATEGFWLIRWPDE